MSTAMFAAVVATLMLCTAGCSGSQDTDETVQGFGASRPVAANETGGKDSPEGRAQNRRVELRYQG